MPFYHILPKQLRLLKRHEIRCDSRRCSPSSFSFVFVNRDEFERRKSLSILRKQVLLITDLLQSGLKVQSGDNAENFERARLAYSNNGFVIMIHLTSSRRARRLIK